MILDFNDLSSDNTRRLNEIADEIKDAYTKFVDDQCRRFGDDHLFWVTPFVSRNIYNDDTFLHISRVLLAKELVSAQDAEGVVTQTYGEYRTLQKLLNGSVRLSCPESRISFKSARNTINRWRHFFSYAKRQIAYVLYAPKGDFDYPKRISVVIGPAISTDFDGYRFNDRYTTGITDYHEALFLPYIVNSQNLHNKTVFDRIRNCENCRFIYDRDLLKVSDVWGIIRYWGYADRIKKNSFIFCDIDVTDIVRQSLETGKNNSTSFDGIIIRRMLKRLAAKKVTVDNFIHWYEGRPFDIAAVAAAREFFPDANCVGYEGYPLIEADPGEYVSEYQYRSGHAPLCMAIPSREYEPDAHRFCKEVPLLYVPIIRNEYILKEKAVNTGPYKTILVLLSYTPEASLELLQGVYEFVNKNDKQLHIMVKNHPTNDGFKLKDYGFNDELDVEFVTGKLTDCLDGVDVAVSSLTSSTLEVLFAGIPVIVHYLRGQLGYTSVPQSVREKLCRIVYSPGQIVAAIEECLEGDRVDNSVLEGVLVPKTRENVCQMFR